MRNPVYKHNMNTVNWTLWLLLAMTYCALTYNPLYQLLLFAALAAAAVSGKQPLKTYVKTGLLASAIPLFVNTFLIHMGETVVYTIPASVNLNGLEIPLPIFAGPITIESTSVGVVMTIFLVNMLTAFQIFNSTTTPDAILRLMPSSMPGVALITSISLRFIPTVAADHSSIRDAQVSRGVRLDSGPLRARIRNHASTLAPTVITALERAFNLAESMASRGYTGGRTRYRHERWGRSEKIVSLAYMLSLLLTLHAKYAGAFDYWPYESTRLPAPSLLALMPLAALAIPILLKNERR